MPRSSRTEELPTPAADPRRAARVALRWISEPDCTEELTHAELLDQAARAAAALTRLGVRAGDRVAVHLPLVPESVIATLACGRLDVVRASLPMGLRPHELRDRIREVGAKVVITADAGQHGGEIQPLKRHVDRALVAAPRCGPYWWSTGWPARCPGGPGVTCGGTTSSADTPSRCPGRILEA
ncbi:AMP-binding protein [Streptomyces indonesiensis]